MDPYATSHLSHDTVLNELKTLDARDRRTTALLLSRVVEVEERELFLREGYPSMHAYCIQGLHWCEGTASRRIYAARTARRFPFIFDAIADGRLHVTAVVMLSKYLTAGNADELLAAATHKSKAEIQLLIAERFPQPDLPEVLLPLAPPPSPIPAMAAPQGDEHSPENARAALLPAWPPDPVPDRRHSPENAAPLGPRPEVKPLAPGRFGLQCTLDREAYDLLEEIRALTAHSNPTGEILAVVKGAFKCYVGELRKQKFAATDRPRPAKPGASPHHIPAAVKRAVFKRDGGQCAFVGDNGTRCTARGALEYDHIEPVARGGDATLENVRLLCRAHNAYAAERAFGAEFMDRKRHEARERGWRARR